MGVGIASAGISLSLFLGLTASVVYVILAGIKWASEQLEGSGEELDIDKCARCGCNFTEVEDGTCSMCDYTICSQCSVQYEQDWLCGKCIKKRDEELKEKIWVLSKFRERFDSVSLTYSKHGKERDVRDYVEKVTENIVGGKLDDVRIDRITQDPAYLNYMEKYEDLLSLTLSRLTTAVTLIVDSKAISENESARKIRWQLKQLVNEIIAEASTIQLGSEWKHQGQALESKTYEDILATAILNKILENVTISKNYAFSHLENSSKVDEFSSLEKNDLNESNSEFDFFQDLLDEQLNLKLDDAWKDNWFLEKKNTDSNNSVAMLIPLPNGKATPLIGDKEADQLSDLSDIEDEYFQINEKKWILPDAVDDTINKEIESKNVIQNEKNIYIDDFEALDANDSGIVEAKNSIFSYSGPSSDEDEDIAKNEKDRDFSEVTHQNTTKITLCHLESSKDKIFEDSLKERLSVKQLARQFSKGEPLSNSRQTVHSLTARNISRDHKNSSLHSNIEYWEKMMRKQR